MNEKLDYWLSNKRFLVIAIILFTMFLILMAILVWQGENIARNPCQICAKKMGDKVTCSIVGSVSQSRDFYPNFTIIDRNFGG